MRFFSAFIKATRPRTYPLAIAGILVGNGLAYQQMQVFSMQQWLVLALSLWVALNLQILSNLANDYGDGIRGTDTHRQDRQIAQGTIHPATLKKLIIIWAWFTFFCGVGLLWLSFDNIKDFLIFLAFGIIAILSAMAYTMGKNPYGYRAKGEIAVFIFFGLLNVCGSLYLQTQKITLTDIMIAIAIGLLCTCVLIINNLRDIHEDKLAGKNTLATILGKQKMISYYQQIIMISYILFAIYAVLQKNSYLLSLILLTYLVYQHLRTVKQYANQQINNQQLAPELKNIVKITLFTSILFMLSNILIINF